MKIKIIYLASLLLVSTSLSLSSCSQDSDPAEAAQTDQSISFAPYIAQTRSSVADIETLKEDGFHVWISHNKGTTFERDQDNVSYLYDEPVHYSMPLDGWDYLNKRFWPTDDAKLSFFALANGGQNLSTEHTKTDAGAPVYTFDCPAAFANQTDLLVAQDLDKAKTTNQVRFDFQHMLSKIQFAATADVPDNYTVTLKKVEVFYKSDAITNKADIDLNDMGVDPVQGAYYTGGEAVSAGIVYSNGEGVELPSIEPLSLINNEDNNHLMLIPQVYNEGDIYLSVSYDIDGSDDAHYSNSEGANLKDSYTDVQIMLPTAKNESGSNIGWQKGKQYTYVLNITADEVTFGAMQVADWGTQTNTNVPDIPVMRPIYYKDGVFHINNAEGLKIFSDIVGDRNQEVVPGYTENNGVPNDQYADGQLESDIDLSTVCGEAIGKSWVKIGNDFREYRGYFDGQNHIISNLYIANADNYTGLFGWVRGGSISNVTIQHATVHGNNVSYLASLIGVCQNTPVTNCHARGILSIGGENPPYIGGLISHYDGSRMHSLSDCSVQGDTNSISISGTNYTGVLVAEVYYAVIINCYVQAGAGGIVVTGNSHVGGFLGYCYDTTIVGCYTAGAAVTGTSNTGAFIGSVYNDSHIYGSWANCSSLQGSVNGFYGTIDSYNATISNCHYRLNDADALNAQIEDLNTGISTYNNGAAADKQAAYFNTQGTYGPIVSTEMPN